MKGLFKREVSVTSEMGNAMTYTEWAMCPDERFPDELEIVYAAPGKLTPVPMPEWEQAEVSEFREWIFERERRLGGQSKKTLAGLRAG